MKIELDIKQIIELAVLGINCGKYNATVDMLDDVISQWPDGNAALPDDELRAVIEDLTYVDSVIRGTGSIVKESKCHDMITRSAVAIRKIRNKGQS